MPKKALELANAMHITVSVFNNNDDESDPNDEYVVWFEELVPHAPTEQRWHNCTGQS
jgi:hypothetical protein